MRHWLKTLPPYFQAVFDGFKTFEVRRDDRGFEPGDTLYLQEYHPANGYTGRLVGREVTYVLRSGEGDFGIEPGFVVMGLRKIQLPSLSPDWPAEQIAAQLRIEIHPQSDLGQLLASGERKTTSERGAK